MIRYVALGSSALRLADDEYYRDAGAWSVKYIERDGKLLSVSDKPWLHNIELIPITEKEWRLSNRGYVKDLSTEVDTPINAHVENAMLQKYLNDPPVYDLPVIEVKGFNVGFSEGEVCGVRDCQGVITREDDGLVCRVCGRLL